MRVSELKQVLLGCSPNTAAGDTLVLGKRRMVRNVTLTRRADEQLGISIVVSMGCHTITHAYVYIYTTHVYTHAHTAYIHAHADAYTYVCIHTHMHARTHGYTCIKFHQQSLLLVLVPHLQGGSELGVPILIAGLEEDKVAYTCGDLQIGDAILSINGESLQVFKGEGVGRLVL